MHKKPCILPIGAEFADKIIKTFKRVETPDGPKFVEAPNG